VSIAGGLRRWRGGWLAVQKREGVAMGGEGCGGEGCANYQVKLVARHRIMF